MKKIILTFALLLFVSAQSFAHYLWIETSPEGEKNKEQEVRVYFGEYTYGVIEKVNGEAFPSVKDFTLWLVDANGNKSEITVKSTEDYYVGAFTPKSNGIYTVVLDNDKIDVIDYTAYDFGIFKTHYNSIAKVKVGSKTGETAVANDSGITVKDVSENNEEVKLQVLFKNKPLPKNEFKVYVSDLWTKTLETDENGYVSFKKPWDTKYIIETTFEERTPGSYKGEAYEFIWHCATYCIK
ncbi:DUF4198 domain-containing protein [Cellulophaga baltica]|uniref:DUF4198 domain-containing protein n=1 Tax=Cellulophaga TaxID=104264 RepID=UPI001C066156|nr:MULTISPECIES: DUF4198 domain-containing protein [Cellulophaga]MBU2996465.1 DUF4198 domain-containing protein [Cellulophaga baltica]MDO6767859.1 DUF4198 domain-containing protein [Cellulophaga sp. 1_MG-2023]